MALRPTRCLTSSGLAGVRSSRIYSFPRTRVQTHMISSCKSLKRSRPTCSRCWQLILKISRTRFRRTATIWWTWSSISSWRIRAMTWRSLPAKPNGSASSVAWRHATSSQTSHSSTKIMITYLTLMIGCARGLAAGSCHRERSTVKTTYPAEPWSVDNSYKTDAQESMGQKNKSFIGFPCIASEVSMFLFMRGFRSASVQYIGLKSLSLSANLTFFERKKNQKRINLPKTKNSQKVCF